jgi:hypothetical protein
MKSYSKWEEITQQPLHQRPIFECHGIGHTMTSFDGQDYVEEHCEKMTGSDGETRTARQWCLLLCEFHWQM